MTKMTAIPRSFCLGLGVALALGTASIASAQPAPAPAPAPAPPDAGSGAGSGSGTATAEKAGSNETLQSGEGDRPWATGVSEAERAAALALFHDGNSFLNDGLFVKAADKYREALKHWDHPAINYNLALALLNLDQPVEVYTSLLKATKYGAAPLEKDKYEHAKEYLLVIEKLLADLEVSCDKPGAKVLVDGKQVFVAPGKYAQKVRIGKHVFIAEKEGYQARVKAPFIGPGEKFRIELKLYTAEDLTRYHRKWQKTWVPYAVMGSGVVFGIVGGLLELSAKNGYQDFDRKVVACNMNNQGCAVDSPGLKAIRDSADTKQTIGYVGYGFAAGALITGGVLAYLNRQEPYQIRPEQIQGEKPEPDDEKVSITPIVTPTFGGAAIQGHF